MDTAAHDPHVALQAKLQVQAVQKVERIAVGLNAAILAVQGDEPVVAVVAERREERNSGDGALPCGLFSPRQHDGSLETALRSCVQAKIGIELGSTRQICTLGAPVASNGSAQAANEPGVAVSYLALVDPSRINDRDGATWRSWYAYFPWEDWRRGKPGVPDGDHRAPPEGLGAVGLRDRRGGASEASACASPSAATARPGTRRRRSIATSF